jgi:P4 family phage/plasmid primase-like protien
MAKKHESHPSELTGLFKVKLVLSSEIEEGSYWNEQRLKELTGDENITARYMRQDSFTFQKTHKHLILGNHRPQIKTIDQAIKSRVLLVPFDVSFAGREDRDLPEKLKAESGFVLHWLMQGHSEWLANGKKLPACDAVTKATQEYFSAQSTIEMWIDENCDLIGDDGRSKKEWPKASALFFDYQEWKRSRGEMPVTQTRFSEAMRNKCEKVFVSGVLHYVGIVLQIGGKNVFSS